MTLPTGTSREGEGSAATNPAATNLCSADTNVWTVALDRPRASSPVSGGTPLVSP